MASIKTYFVFFDNIPPTIKPVCQTCSNWILDTLLLKEKLLKEEINKKKEEKFSIKKAYSENASNRLLSLDREIDQLKNDLSSLRYDTCRKCGHSLTCACNLCKDSTKQNTLVIVYTTSNKFRHAVHLHTKCNTELRQRLGDMPLIPIQTTLTK